MCWSIVPVCCALLGRWEHRVTLLRGGPGLGKTTLLAQAIAENRLAPRGGDVWVGVEPYDSEGASLAQAIRAALSWDGTGSLPGAQGLLPVDVETVTETVWQRSPTEICIVLDDAHLLTPNSKGAVWLTAFIEALPANGHLLLASRTEPAVSLARLEGSRGVLRFGEDELRLTTGELDEFAAGRGVDPRRLDVSGGWPAMAELAARTERHRGGAFLWEEVLEPLGSMRRHLLGIVTDLGGADDRLATAAAGASVDLARELGGVPLVAAGADGWFVPHGLWRTAPGMALEPGERAEVRRRAVHDLVERDRIDQAFTLVREAELWDVAPAVLRAACLQSERLNPSQLERCFSASPADVRSSPPGRLANALRLAFTQPAAAIEPLRIAADECRAAGDIEAELTALAQLGRLAWGRHDSASIVGEVAGRIAAIEERGNPTARGLAAFIRALAADLAGDDSAVLAELDTIEPGVLDPVWTAMALWLRGGVRLDQGDAEAVAEMIENSERTADPAITSILGGLRARTLWALGRIDQTISELPALLDALRDAGVASIHAQGLTNASLALSYTGQVDEARECLAEASAAATAPVGMQSARTALVTASLQLAEGDEERAAATIREAMNLHGGPDRGADRRVWRHVLSLSYILVPETRPHWDTAALRGHLATGRTLAAALVAARRRHGDERLWQLDVSDIGHVRSGLHYRHAAELAVHLNAAGRSQGSAILDALGPPGRTTVQELALGPSRPARHAKNLLTTVPAPPPLTTYLDVLGPLTVWRGTNGDRGEVVDPELRRGRVRALLAYLVGHRRTQRPAITAALWPDLDDASASNNLGVTLNHLLHALEPWRTPGEPPYLIRLDGQRVELITGDHLRVDVDAFTEHLASSVRAEAAGSPSVALEHDLAATALYRGDLFSDVPEAHWLDMDQAHYRARFVTISTRAAQLLVARGETDRAEALAERALIADPWNENAYTVIASAALARGNRSAARSVLQRCLTALAELGAEPTGTTHQLGRRCGIPADLAGR